MTTPKQTIPVVDLNDFKTDSEQDNQRFVNTVGKGLEDLGFFAVENHGIDYNLIAKAYKLCEDFFDLPEKEKLKYEIENGGGQRGFTSYGKEHAKGIDAPDLKEFWHVGREFEDTNHSLYNVYPKNIWPVQVPEFKAVMAELYRQIDTCAASLLKACALYLGAPEDLLSNMALDGNSILRVIHYPPIPEDANPSSIRAGAHEDINLITLLCESTAEGLELLQRDGQWRPIHALKGQIVADAGDMLQNVTNGIIKSTTHRVVNPNNDRSRRFSMPFFVHPRSEVDLSPLGTTVDLCGGEKRYPNITAGAYLKKRLEEIGLM